MADHAVGADGPASASVRSPGYRGYVLAVLIAIYTCNFIDRNLMGVLGQSIKAELLLQDWQLGVLAGPAFALLYCLGSLPVARLAERKRRVTIISIATSVWSAMTALCGLATGFWALMLARVGVGLGEGGYPPSAYSLVADYFPPEKRATASGLFTVGVPLGSFFGAVLGGYLAQTFGWRTAFLALGLPGLLLALIVITTVREPARGALDPPDHTSDEAPSFGEVLRRLASRRAFKHLLIAGVLSGFANYAIVQFAIPFLLRGYHVDLKTAAGLFGIYGAVAAGVGIAAGGYVSDWVGKKDPRLRAIVPGVSMIIAAPLYMLAFMQPTIIGLGGFVILPSILQYQYMGPLFAMPQNMVTSRMRATAAAIVNITITLIGLGFGPPLIGALSDMFAAKAYTGLMPFVHACPGGLAPKGAVGFAAESCRLASFHGLRQALLIAAAIYVWAGVHLLLAARTLREDLNA